MSIIGNQGPRRQGKGFEIRERNAEMHEKVKAQIEADAAATPPGIARQGERPSKRAQWDEHRGCWVEWDAGANDWVVVGGDADDLPPAP